MDFPSTTGVCRASDYATQSAMYVTLQTNIVDAPRTGPTTALLDMGSIGSIPHDTVVAGTLVNRPPTGTGLCGACCVWT